jgi:hypothetical protein
MHLYMHLRARKGYMHLHMALASRNECMRLYVHLRARKGYMHIYRH